MKLNLSNTKHRNAFIIILLTFSALIFTIIGYLGTKNIYEAKLEIVPSPTPSASPSASPSPTPSPSTTVSATSELEKLRQEKQDLQEKLDEANNNLNVIDSKQDTIAAYNNFLEYMTQVIDAHDGFTGWTDAEYAIAHEKAVATGNNDFVNTVDITWNNTSIDVTTRILNVYRGIISGINSNLD